MLSGVELHLPRQIVASASSTTHTEVCSRETSSPTYCCCGFMVVLRFVTTEAPMLKAHLLPRLPDVPTRALTRRQAGVRRDRRLHDAGVRSQSVRGIRSMSDGVADCR